MKRLSDQRAVVTGAGRGLGRTIASALAREGAEVVLCDRTSEELEQAFEEVRSLGGEVRLHRFDLARRDEIEGFVASTLASGGVDVLVNNAAVLPYTACESVSDAEWDETLAVNVTAPFLLIRGFLPSMREGGGGSIVNVTSRAGARGFPREVSYCASKSALEGLTRALAVELAGEPLSVNAVSPGLRIKPTMMTLEEERKLSPRECGWEDPGPLGSAFVYLAAARGRPTGMRFEALALSRAIEQEGFSLSEEVLAKLGG